MKKDIGMARIIEISYFARAIARTPGTAATPSLTATWLVRKWHHFQGSLFKAEMCELVKVMIEKFDDRSGERAVRTQILRRFVIKSLPTDVLVVLY